MKYIKICAGICVVAVCVGAGYYFIHAATTISIDENAFYPIDRVIDGDTLKVSIGGKIITVRTLGINTPETVDPRKPVECFGKEASDESKSLLSARQVKLKFNPNRELKDKYGRYLAYVYRDDGLFFNESMIENGFAREYTYGKPYSFQKEFRGIEKIAKESKKGLWGACPPSIK